MLPHPARGTVNAPPHQPVNAGAAPGGPNPDCYRRMLPSQLQAALGLRPSANLVSQSWHEW
jgi:hypothetical protein